TGSVFCSHGAGFVVPWDQVKNHMHLEPFLKLTQSAVNEETRDSHTARREAPLMSLEEIDRIIESTFYANKGKRTEWKRKRPVYEVRREPVYHEPRQAEHREEYLLVDGYNIVFAWPELAELANDNMDGARMKLLDQLCNYQAIRKCRIIAVFDAYRVKEHREEMIAYHNIHLVYTKEAQTADHYIERFAHDNNGKYRITVATSDGLQQMIVRGAGCALLSARELKIEMEAANKRVAEEFQDSRPSQRNYLLDSLSDETKEQLKEAGSEES
ncbi:MAG: NYN domain-containing protein, partial [Paenibacillaceae bacterium]|nr:NYN domain-containing protein [Paenibacillaceae bacterium]